MRNLFLLCIFLGIILAAVLLGSGQKVDPVPRTSEPKADPRIPHIGSVQILNGCGAHGLAWGAAGLLRGNGFDVKNDGIGNAPAFGYQFTLVVSRTPDMTVARQIGKALRIPPDRVVLLRSDENRFDVTVILGPDLEGRWE